MDDLKLSRQGNKTYIIIFSTSFATKIRWNWIFKKIKQYGSRN